MKQHKENQFISLLLNIVIPTLILMKLSGASALGPVSALLFALSIPFTYGLYDFTQTNKVNIFSTLGLVSILLTGGIGLLELDPKYVAIKEAGIPLIIGIVVAASVKTKYPLLKTFLVQVINADRVYERLDSNGNRDLFEKKIQTANHWFAVSFLLSSVLNFLLAKFIVVSQPGTESFNMELGKMTALSFPVIALPTTIMMAFVIFFVIQNTSKLTELELEEIVQNQRA